MKLAAVITDIDGTVAETEDYHRRAYNDLFAHLGLEQHWDQNAYSKRLAMVGGAKFAEIMDWLDVPECDRPARKKELYAWKSQRFEELVVADLKSGGLPVRTGIIPLFEEILANGLVLSAASTCVKPAAIGILKAALGDDLFGKLTVICAGDDVKKKKPQPDIFLMAAEMSGVPPAACMAIEDTGHGLAAAKAAGMSCITTPSEFAGDDDFTPADANFPKGLAPKGLTIADLHRIHQGG